MKLKSAAQVRGKNIVVMGGGTGTYTVLSGLKKYPVNLAGVVSMADDGGSTRVIREEFGILPPGSVRPALVALSDSEETLAKLFSYRFEKGTLKGHNFGNLFITALTEQLGSFEKALEETGRILHIRGKVLPSTADNVRLCARLEDGTVVKGEAEIDVPKHNPDLKIVKIWTEPSAKASKNALEAIGKADLIVIGPGDLFTSILPNFLARGISNAVRKSKAKKVFVCNLMTKPGETAGFSVKDFVAWIENYIGEGTLDWILVNTKKPSEVRVKKYEKAGARAVQYEKTDFTNARFGVILKPLARQEGFIRHDPDVLARVLLKLL
ncbi:MAG: YvcK family protein [Candidatus Wildermuthbacteria bacterium]|nr:YvcK family protein [Candidatus Wildermuthbacteria bacterium]